MQLALETSPEGKYKEIMNCYANSCDANEFKVEGLVVRETRFCAWPLQKESLVIRFVYDLKHRSAFCVFWRKEREVVLGFSSYENSGSSSTTEYTRWRFGADSSTNSTP